METKKEKENTNAENVNRDSSKKIKSMVLVVLFLLLSLGIYMLSCYFAEQKAIQRENERKQTIKDSLYYLGLGNRKCGSTDINTSNYSWTLGFLKSALADDAYASASAEGYDGTKREYYFEQLRGYCDKPTDDYLDYLMVFSTLLLGIDGLQQKDIDYFALKGTIEFEDLEKNFVKVLSKYGLSLSSLLVDENDERICYNMSLRIRLAEDGYPLLNDYHVATDMYGFVFGGKGLATVDEKVLEKDLTYEEFRKSYEEYFTGEKVYFEDLTTSGKLVFLYMMPTYVRNSRNKELSVTASWEEYQVKFYLSLWDLLRDEKLSKVVD